jgi:hypothetical protein
VSPDNENAPGASGEATQARGSTSQLRGNAIVSIQRQAILDHRLPHGAFRLFNYLRDRQNKSGQVYATQRQIATDLKCKQDSIIEWTKILQECGYVAIERVGQNHNFRYTILCGDGKVALPEWASRAARTRATLKGSTKENLALPEKEDALPKGASPRAPRKGSLRSIVSGIDIKGGESPVNYFPRELDKAIEDQRAAIRRKPMSDALWKKLHELETLKHGAPVTVRKPNNEIDTFSKPNPRNATAANEQKVNIFELKTDEERADMVRQLKEAADNPQP